MSSIEFRRATDDDFAFCWSLYRDLMEPLTSELLEWNEEGQRRTIEVALADDGTFLIVADGADIGWVQTLETDDGLTLGQLYVIPSMQNRGIGTAVVRELCDRAHRASKPITLEVMKNNRARALYERLGFVTTGSTRYKFTMQWRAKRPIGD